MDGLDSPGENWPQDHPQRSTMIILH